MLASDLSLADKIDHYVDSYHKLLTRHPYLLTYIVSEAARRPEFLDDFYSAERRQAARRMVDKLRDQIDEQVRKKGMTPVSAEQFFTTLAGSCLFPFVAVPMLREALGLSLRSFSEFMEERRTALPAFLKRSFEL